ncbi:MAG: 50S ribosomal protein L11 methyltransferase [Lachnospiraceae bacterium]|nr:50S ribosomal protein L11 methyltransferase [Lachnospiraceae bacterium]
MKWRTLTVHTTAEAEDLVADMLSELGITGVEVKDRRQVLDDDTMDLFEDLMPEPEKDDGLAEVIFYLDEDEDPGDMLSKVREGLSELSSFVDIGEGTITEDETEDKDWVNNWKEHFSAFYVDDILIKPTWADYPEDRHESMVVEIDPGTAFGTGSHETTQLCIRALKKWMKQGDRVLDVGTGSGILGIIALKLGASEAFGTDIDELAVDAARENIEKNGIDETRFPVVLGDIISDDALKELAGYGRYDMVVSNILADIIIPLQKILPAHMKRGGILNVSGIINTKAEQVKDALLRNEAFELIDQDALGEWVSFTVRKK